MGTLVNAIKAIFASKKTTDSNYAVPLLNKNDASPAGYMELPDLAAVAAGVLFQEDYVGNVWFSGKDYNNLPNGIVYSGQLGNNQNAPSCADTYSVGFVITVANMGGVARKVQVAFGSATGNKPAFIAIRNLAGTGWQPWRSIALS